MTDLTTFEGALTPAAGRFCIAAARFNAFIVEHLIAGATDALVRHGIDRAAIDLVRAPGSFELPQVVNRLAAKKRYQGIIALGAVIRGGTPHFEYVAGECVKGLAQVALQYDVPVSFGVLTVDTLEQAIERAGTKAGNKGAEAALSVLEMVNLYQALEQG